MLVFGINTAVNAQTKLVITNDETQEQVIYEFDKDLTESEFKDTERKITSAFGNNQTYGSSFTIELIKFDHYTLIPIYEFSGSFNFDRKTTITDIYYSLIRLIQLM